MKKNRRILAIVDLYPNLSIMDTGGHCLAYSHPFDDGGYLLLTGEGGGDLPEDDDEQICCGVYSDDGDCIEGGDFIAVDELEGWIDATLAKHSRTLDELSGELRDYCRSKGLPQLSADELLAVSVNMKQSDFLRAFCARWDLAAKRDREPLKKHDPAHTLEKVRAALDGKEWSADTTQAIAEILRDAGLHIGEFEGEES